MKSTSSQKTPGIITKLLRLCGIIILSTLVIIPAQTQAQDSLAITVTPPFFNLTMNPGDYWSSIIKVVNTNPAPLTIQAVPASFTPTSEEGYGAFTTADKPSAAEVAHWIEVLSGKEITIPPGQVGEIRFAIQAPKDASPGGHYGAILIGQGAGSVSGNGMGISSVVSSLLFVRVTGNIVERGRIRDFSISNTHPSRPAGQFQFRFENEGNVHLQPQGDIEIKNMWGQDRGKILINQETDFGNVLPNSVRKFAYDWSAKDAYFDIGRFTATLTLAYGAEGRQNSTATIVFWVIPWDRLAALLGSILGVILVFWLSIRAYVRKVMQLERARYGGPNQVPRPPAEMVFEPIRQSAVDLRHYQRATPKEKQKLWAAYKPLFRYLLLLFAAAAILWVILNQILEPNRPSTSAKVRPGSVTTTTPLQ